MNVYIQVNNHKEKLAEGGKLYESLHCAYVHILMLMHIIYRNVYISAHVDMYYTCQYLYVGMYVRLL